MAIIKRPEQRKDKTKLNIKKIEKLVLQISEYVMEQKYPDINKTLEFLGKALEADRIAIYDFHENGKIISNTYEWTSIKIKPQKNTLQNIKAENIPCLMEKLKKDKIFKSFNLTKLSISEEKELKILSKQEFRGGLFYPVKTKDKLTGFICFQKQEDIKDWNDRDIHFLNIIVKLITITREGITKNRLTDKFINTTVKGLTAVMNMIDLYTATHQKKVAKLSELIGAKMGYGEEDLKKLKISGMLHDIGKINVPTELLIKPAKLNNSEFELIKKHPVKSFEIVKKLNYSNRIAQIILQHHERNDGSGYPYGLVKKEILPEAQILIIADVVEAMASHRPYRPALGLETAIREIKKNSGLKYDSDIVKACINLFRQKELNFLIKEI